MGNSEFETKAIELVKNYYKKELNTDLKKENIYVVWLTKVLQNNKALISTNVQDTRYFEITYNGDKKETYIDCYVKEKNICKKDKEE